MNVDARPMTRGATPSPASTRPYPYQLRAIRFVELWHCQGWDLKIYGINHHRPAAGDLVVSPRFVSAAKQVIDGALRHNAPDPGGSPRAGFVVLHQGKLARWLLLDLWRDWVLMHHMLYRANLDTPVDFRPVGDGLCACTWELRVISFERDAWLAHLVAAPDQPDVAAYLRTQLAEDS
jgi:hypothetical protein